MASSAENADSHSYVVGNGISTFKAIFEMSGQICAISIQKSLQDFSLILEVNYLMKVDLKHSFQKGCTQNDNTFENLPSQGSSAEFLHQQWKCGVL